MPIKSSINAAKIEAEINERLQGKKRYLIEQLFYIAEECLNNARDNHGYHAQTGNLQSSVGYCILDNGEIIKAGIWEPRPGKHGDGKEGMQKGIEFLNKIAQEQPRRGITFLMVAGMPYAKYVEDMSLDVLDTSEQMAIRKIKELVARVVRQSQQ